MCFENIKTLFKIEHLFSTIQKKSRGKSYNLKYKFILNFANTILKILITKIRLELIDY